MNSTIELSACKVRTISNGEVKIRISYGESFTIVTSDDYKALLKGEAELILNKGEKRNFLELERAVDDLDAELKRIEALEKSIKLAAEKKDAASAFVAGVEASATDA